MIKRFFIVATAFHIALCVKPPNYIEKPKVPDKYPPKYEYNYFIANRNNQAAQGHKEIRNGDNTAGNYFVNLPKGESKTMVNYIADEWGFFPITRYMSHGPHHHVSGHFALGQHAVERLNETSLNTNEVFMNEQQQQQQSAEVSKPLVESKTKLYPIPSPSPSSSSPQDQMQLIPAANQLFLQHQKHQPLIYQQHSQQIPLIYEYAQQQAPHVNYFYPQKPQDIIYHQQPIISMAQFHRQPSPSTFLPAILPLDINLVPQHSNSGNLLQINSNDDSVATMNQETAKVKDDESRSQEVQFEAPIVVNDGNSNNVVEPTILVQQKSNQVKNFNYQPQKPQINIQILSDAKTSTDQIDSSTPKIVNAHTNSNNYQYLVADDQDLLGSTPSSQKEAPSRAFLRNFKKFTLTEHPTTTQAFVTTTTARPIDGKSENNCCKNSNEENTVAITQRPISNNFLAPVHAAVRLTNENLEDCIDGHGADKKTIVEVRKNVNVKIVTSTRKPLVFGDRIILESTPTPPVVAVTQQPIFIEKTTPAQTAVFHHPIVVEKEVFIKSPPQIVEKIVHQPIVKTIEKPVFIEKIVKQPVEVEKIRPVYIKSPPETKYVETPVIVEKAVIKEVKVPVEKTVYVKSPPETKIVHQPVIQTVEKPVFIEKIVKQPYEVEKIVEKIVDRPVDRIVEKPVIHTVEKIVEKPIYQTIEKPVYIEKFIDRPVEKIVEKPIVQTVEKIVEKPVIQTVEKIVDRPVIQTVEKPVYIEKIVDRPVEKIVDRPVIQTVEKFIDRPVIQTVEKIVDRPVIQTVEKPVYIEKIVDRPVEKIVDRPVFQTVEKYIDRPYPVPYAVPIEKHVYHNKPDFHVIAKAVPTKHKLFDFDALLRFLTKKEEVKHIYVPATPQHQVNQLNKHQLIAAYTSFEPIKESPVLDFTRYATSHLNPIKPVYGVPSFATTLLKPVTYSNPDPYAGNYNSNQGVASVPHSWVNDNYASQSLTTTIHKDNYVGSLPTWEDYWANNAVSTKEGIKFRRNVENGRSLRIEYGGFLPKMNPSVEIDENGTPLKKEAET